MGVGHKQPLDDNSNLTIYSAPMADHTCPSPGSRDGGCSSRLTSGTLDRHQFCSQQIAQP
jgi:hypothetical protein